MSNACSQAVGLAKLTKIEGTILYISTTFGTDKSALRRKCQAQHKQLKVLPPQVVEQMHPKLKAIMSTAMGF